MFDCADVEMRELLPDMAAGSLDDATRARVEQHLASCAECASELETLHLVRSAYATTPRVDVQRIVAALPKAVPLPERTHGAQPVKRWIDWRVAAALTMISVGGFSLAVARHQSNETRPRDFAAAVASVDTQRAQPVKTAVSGGSPSSIHDTTRPVARSGRAASAPQPKAQLAFAGGTDDMDDASIKVLLGALDEMDRAPVAPSAEPDPTPVLPVIKTGQP
jgi:anti-sigma factor RsiW